jgi:hypothetical protein
MGRSRRGKESGAGSYSVIQMPSFKMDIHQKQQNLIFSELTAARQKLIEENQVLRDELAEAKMIIRFLKSRLDESEARMLRAPAVKSKDSTAKQGIQSSFMRIPEKPQKKRYIFKSKTSSRREAFLNPRPPGSKSFATKARRSLSPPDISKRLTPRSSFSPIRECDEAEAEKEGNHSPLSDSQIQQVTRNFKRTSLG